MKKIMIITSVLFFLLQLNAYAQDYITRFEAVKYMVGIEEIYTGTTSNYSPAFYPGKVFDDTVQFDEPDSFEKNRELALALGGGIISESDDRKFRPNDFITREEFATMLTRTINDAYRSIHAKSHFEISVGKAGEMAYVADNKDISPWARDSVDYIINHFIMKTDENENFNPKEYISTDEMKNIVHTFMTREWFWKEAKTKYYSGELKIEVEYFDTADYKIFIIIPSRYIRLYEIDEETRFKISDYMKENKLKLAEGIQKFNIDNYTYESLLEEFRFESCE